MPLTFQIEKFADCEIESRPLQHAHWAETEGFRHALDFSPDITLRIRNEAAGNYVYATARTEAGDLVGHCSFTIRPRSFYTDDKQGFEDFVFLLPDFRKGRNFHRLWTAAENEVIHRGVRELRVSSGADKARLWESLGYSEATRTYAKIITEKT